MAYSDAYDPLEGIAIIGMAGRFPECRDVDALWQQPARAARMHLALRGRRARARASRGHARARESGLRARARRARRRRTSSTRTSSASRRRRPRSSIRSSACSSRSRGKRSSTRATTRSASRADRRLRRRDDEQLLPAEPASRPRRHRAARRAADADGQREGLHRDARRLQARSQGPGAHVQTACSTSLVAVCTGGAEPADVPVRHGARRRRSIHAAAAARLSATRKARSSSPDGHCRAFDARRRRHGLQQRRSASSCCSGCATRSPTATRSTP